MALNLMAFEGTVVRDFRFMELEERRYKEIMGRSPRDEQGVVTPQFKLYLKIYDKSDLTVAFNTPVTVGYSQVHGMMLPLAVHKKVHVGQHVKGMFNAHVLDDGEIYAEFSRFDP